ncbi:D-alanyl-D-alanine carboxypeptidase family protein [Corynebacterium sp. H78]|uniref:D-alanyl-D-alanine carboxypeptidase family protein n=1 Tax=Corynebacterium sp. H78 TaxID=3133417 RepID=UPI0030A29707
MNRFSSLPMASSLAIAMLLASTPVVSAQDLTTTTDIVGEPSDVEARPPVSSASKDAPDEGKSAEEEKPEGPATETRDTSRCDFRVTPPPAVDTSEIPKPGQPSPEPLPVPKTPAGGARMSDCGLIAAAGFTPPEKTTASAWIVFDTQTGEVIATKDPHGRYRPASIAKVLLALVAIEELPLDQKTKATFEDAAIEGSRAGIVEGTEYDVRTLLLGLLMSSGNDCGSVLTRLLGGEEATLKKVNALANKLGATDTRIGNPTGLDSPGQSTSAFDMALFYATAFNNDTYRELSRTREVEMPGNKELEIEGFTMSNDNQLLASNFEGALGGKTGFTDDARHTFAGVAERNGRRLGSIILDSHIHEGQRAWEQSADLLEAGFATKPGSSVGNLQDLPSANEDSEDKDGLINSLMSPDAAAGDTDTTQGNQQEHANKSEQAKNYALAAAQKEIFGIPLGVVAAFGVVLIIGLITMGGRRGRKRTR